MAGLGLGLGISAGAIGSAAETVTPVESGVAGLLITQDGKSLLTLDNKFIVAQELQQFINTQAGDLLTSQAGAQFVTS